MRSLQDGVFGNGFVGPQHDAAASLGDAGEVLGRALDHGGDFLEWRVIALRHARGTLWNATGPLAGGDIPPIWLMSLTIWG